MRCTHLLLRKGTMIYIFMLVLLHQLDSKLPETVLEIFIVPMPNIVFYTGIRILSLSNKPLVMTFENHILSCY